MSPVWGSIWTLAFTITLIHSRFFFQSQNELVFLYSWVNVVSCSYGSKSLVSLFVLLHHWHLVTRTPWNLSHQKLQNDYLRILLLLPSPFQPNRQWAAKPMVFNLAVSALVMEISGSTIIIWWFREENIEIMSLSWCANLVRKDEITIIRMWAIIVLLFCEQRVTVCTAVLASKIQSSVSSLLVGSVHCSWKCTRVHISPLLKNTLSSSC